MGAQIQLAELIIDFVADSDEAETGVGNIKKSLNDLNATVGRSVSILKGLSAAFASVVAGGILAAASFARLGNMTRQAAILTAELRRLGLVDISGNFVRDARTMNQAFQDMKMAVQSIAATIGRELLPVLKLIRGALLPIAATTNALTQIFGPLVQVVFVGSTVFLFLASSAAILGVAIMALTKVTMMYTGITGAAAIVNTKFAISMALVKIAAILAGAGFGFLSKMILSCTISLTGFIKAAIVATGGIFALVVAVGLLVLALAKVAAWLFGLDIDDIDIPNEMTVKIRPDDSFAKDLQGSVILSSDQPTQTNILGEIRDELRKMNKRRRVPERFQFGVENV